MSIEKNPVTNQTVTEPIQRLTTDERETILIYNDADKYWEIYSAVPKHMRKFDKLNYEVIKTETYDDGEVMAKFYKVPQNAISFRDHTKKKTLTDEQRAALAERMRNLRKSV